MDDYNQKIRLGQGQYGGASAGPEMTSIVEKENLTVRLDRLEKEFIEFRQHVLASIEKLSNQISSINSYIGR